MSSIIGLCLIISFLIPAMGQEKNEVSYFSSTAHFDFYWKNAETTEEDINHAKIYCERIYAELIKLLGKRFTPKSKIKIHFSSNGIRTDGQVCSLRKQ